MFNRLRILTFMFITAVLAGTAIAAPAGMVRSELNKGWRFRQARLQQWRTAIVPGVVHTDLLAHGLIEDPFFRLNERAAQWVDKEDWVYETTFDIPVNMSVSYTHLDVYKRQRTTCSASRTTCST